MQNHDQHVKSFTINSTCFWPTLNRFGDYSILWKVRFFPFLTFDRQLWVKAFEMVQATPGGNMVKNRAHTGDITCVTNIQGRPFKAHVLTFILLNHIIKMTIYPTQERLGMTMWLILNIGMMTLKRWVRGRRLIEIYIFTSFITNWRLQQRYLKKTHRIILRHTG